MICLKITPWLEYWIWHVAVLGWSGAAQRAEFLSQFLQLVQFCQYPSMCRWFWNLHSTGGPRLWRVQVFLRLLFLIVQHWMCALVNIHKLHILMGSLLKYKKKLINHCLFQISRSWHPSFITESSINMPAESVQFHPGFSSSYCSWIPGIFQRPNFLHGEGLLATYTFW